MSDDKRNGTSNAAPTAPSAANATDSSVAMGVPIGTPVARVRELTRLGVRLQHVTSRRTGFSPADLSALSILVREVVGPADLARQLDVSTAAATGIVDRLSARGLVERHAIPGDRRRTALHITEVGREVHTRHLRAMVEGLEAIEEEFDADERAVIERYLARAVQVISDAVEIDPDSSETSEAPGA